MRDVSPYQQALLAQLASGALVEFVAAAHAWRKGAHTLPAAVQHARQQIDRHYADPLSLTDLADTAHVTPAHLIRLFRRHLGVTLARYLWQVRVQRGVTLLQRTGLSIAEVAYRTGFQTLAHFSRLIKTHYGLPPSVLRKRAWAGREGGEPTPPP